MLKEQEYYTILNTYFIEKNELLFEKAREKCKNMCFSYNDEQLNKILNITNEIERKYEFNMQNMCKNNYQLLTLFQIEIMGSVSIVHRKKALEFLIACCLADKILDSRRFKQREKISVMKLLTLNYKKDELKREFNILANFINDIIEFLSFYGDKNKKGYLQELIEAAFKSEIYMSSFEINENERFLQKDNYLLIDKSVAFEKSALLLTLNEKYLDREVKLADVIGKIMWLSDDLCDLFQDLSAKRKNSLLYINMPEKKLKIDERVKLFYSNLPNIIADLESYMSELENLCSTDLYYFVINIIEKWFSDIKVMI